MNFLASQHQCFRFTRQVWFVFKYIIGLIIFPFFPFGYKCILTKKWKCKYLNDLTPQRHELHSLNFYKRKISLKSCIVKVSIILEWTSLVFLTFLQFPDFPKYSLVFLDFPSLIQNQSNSLTPCFVHYFPNFSLINLIFIQFPHQTGSMGEMCFGLCCTTLLTFSKFPLLFLLIPSLIIAAFPHQIGCKDKVLYGYLV